MTDAIFASRDDCTSKEAAHICLEVARAGDLDGAEARCRNRIVENPDDGWAHDALGLILCRKHQFSGAIAAFTDATKCRPSQRAHFFHLSAVLTACYLYNDAIAVMKSAAAIWSNDPSIKLGLADALSRQHQNEAAKKIYMDLDAEHPNNAKIWLYFATGMLNAGMADDAFEAIERALALEPTNLRILGIYYARLLAAMGRDDESGKVRSQTLALFGSHERDEFKKIDMCERTGSLSESEALWLAKMQADGQSPAALLGLAQNQARQGRWSDVAETIGKCRGVDNDATLSARIESLLRSAKNFAPRVAGLARVRPDSKRVPGKTMIVVRGALDVQTLDVVKSYRAGTDGIFIILSTWEGTSTALISEISPYVDEVVLNRRPTTPGSFNINYQIACASNGIARARDLGAERALVIRSDIALLKHDFMRELASILDHDVPNTERTPLLCNRIVICEIYTQAVPFYHASDIFSYGNITDLACYWSPAHGVGSCLAPEVILCRGFAQSAGRPLVNTLTDSICAIQDLFIVRDAHEFELFWPKYPAITGFARIEKRPFINRQVWEDKASVPVFIQEDCLPSL